MLCRRPCILYARVLGTFIPGADPWISWVPSLVSLAYVWRFQTLNVLAAVGSILVNSSSIGASVVAFLR